MGGVGITFNSKEEGGQASSKSSPLTKLPPKVVDEIVSALGIVTHETRDALGTGTGDLPDDVEVTITRKLTGESLTLKKLRGGAEFELKFKGRSTRITP